jgi:hypothetical protein
MDDFSIFLLQGLWPVLEILCVDHLTKAYIVADLLHSTAYPMQIR